MYKYIDFQIYSNGGCLSEQNIYLGVLDTKHYRINLNKGIKHQFFTIVFMTVLKIKNAVVSK
ncbi:MAG: hypothetical protein UZ20_WS6002000016 [candidate division WS6 bacterium OLB21]|uniref:Uncharacterized protein n=1 Tax=candidate division WS6 bacterium OLB21 TaxID=1617427 RepID=A0A136KLI6_9BACT|nr:MAG: hypothetical protein UZ20_WS6002000016 [candidate division WS6 bacterium OLB21]